MRLVCVGAVVTYLLVMGGLARHFVAEGHAVAAEPSLQAASEAEVMSPLRMGPVSTGVVEVDDAIRGFLKGDVNEALSHVVVQQVPCGTLPWGGMPQLNCLAAEAAGTAHNVILSACTPEWLTVEAAQAQIGTLLSDKPGISAVTRGASGYSAVLSWPNAAEQTLVLAISPVGITSFRSGCGTPATAKSDHMLKFVTAAER